MTSSPYGPYQTGLHTCYNGNYKKFNEKAILSHSVKITVYGLKTAIRLHEGGITSNRKSARYGEYVTRLCTHRPSHARI